MLVLDIADIAAEQWGLVTTAQARAVGVSPQAMARLTNRGVLERVTHGVYRVAGSAASPLDELRAAWLGLDPKRKAGDRLQSPDAVVSFRSAAKYRQLGDLDADRHEFTVPIRRQSRRADVRFHRENLASGDWQVIAGLPVTTIVKTVEDLAKARTDGGHLAGVVRDAIIAASVDAEQVIAALRPYAHNYGAKLGDGRGLVARFLDEAGIPKSTRQVVDLTTPPAPCFDLAEFQAAAQKLARQHQR